MIHTCSGQEPETDKTRILLTNYVPHPLSLQVAMLKPFVKGTKS